MQASLPKADFPRPKLRTARAMSRLCWAQLLVSHVPFKQWRDGLGLRAGSPAHQASEARHLAKDLEWAAKRLPFETKCLPRAMALSWTLRRRKIAHSVVIAVRPGELRQSPDSLHAWVESGGEIILGNLPGPWIETFRQGESSR